MGIYLVLASYVVLASISAEQVPMHCNSPMQIITTYVGFNYCRSVLGIELNEEIIATPIQVIASTPTTNLKIITNLRSAQFRTHT